MVVRLAELVLERGQLVLLRLQFRPQTLVFILQILTGILETGELMLKTPVFSLVLVNLETSKLY